MTLETLSESQYDMTQPKQKNVIMFSEQPGSQPKLEKQCNYEPLKTWVTHKLPCKWSENEEVLCHLKNDLKPPTSQLIKPTKS